MRHEDIEAIFHRTSGVEPRYHGHSSTMTLSSDGLGWSLGTSDEIASARAKCLAFVVDEALSFLEREYTFQEISAMLNTDPTGDSRYFGFTPDRFHHGLIAARLADDPTPTLLALVQYSTASMLFRQRPLEDGKVVIGSPLALPMVAASLSIVASIVTIARSVLPH